MPTAWKRKGISAKRPRWMEGFATLTVAGAGIGGTPARARALLDEFVGSR